MNTTTELLDLTCKECGKPYQKPAIYKDWPKERTQNVFFKWSLDYCDECRRAKERAALTKLPQVLELLSQSLEPNPARTNGKRKPTSNFNRASETPSPTIVPTLLK